MERFVDIWYLSSGSSGNEMAAYVEKSGFPVTRLGSDISKCAITPDRGHVVIVDLEDRSFTDILKLLNGNPSIETAQTYVFVSKEEIGKATERSREGSTIEFIERPVNKREFLILLEKTVFVERYREMMKTFSRGAEDRLEAYRSLMVSHGGAGFENETRRLAFDKIIRYEKNLIEEQKNLNDAIREFTASQQRSIAEMKDFLEAGERLDGLRREERINADITIKAQQSVIEFSAQELMERERILEAQERTYELSREEAKALHDQVKKLRAENETLRRELETLKSAKG